MPRRAALRQQPTPAAATPMAFARAIAGALRRDGRNPDAALRQAQITPSQLKQVSARITSRQMEVLSAAAMQELDDEALGAFSRKLPWGSYGMIARASITSPDLGVALKRWCRHHGLLTNDIAVSLTVSSGTATIAIGDLRDPRRQPASSQIEFNTVHLLRNIHGLACWYIDSRIGLQGASFPFPAPPHAAAYEIMFPGGPLQFDAPRAEIRFDAKYLALPLKRDEKALRQMLQHALPLTVLQYRRDRLIVQQVRQALLANASQAHSAESIASLLNVSARTLHRQLKDEGASLQQLKDEVRSERAKELLHRSGRPVKQVAALVGFRNEKSFTRAFKAWTGVGPAAFAAANER
jgi:AraC-like DNA-binding protein